MQSTTKRFDINVISSGEELRYSVGKIFIEFGPYCIYKDLDADGFAINPFRLDGLLGFDIISDKTTTDTKMITNGTEVTNNKNLVKRAVVGGLILGPGAAAVGALSSERKVSNETIVEEKINTNVTAKLTAHDGEKIIVLIKNSDHIDFFSSFLNSKRFDQELMSLELNRFKKSVFDKNRNFETQKIRANILIDVNKSYEHRNKKLQSEIDGKYKFVRYVIFASWVALMVIFNDVEYLPASGILVATLISFFIYGGLTILFKGSIEDLKNKKHLISKEINQEVERRLKKEIQKMDF